MRMYPREFLATRLKMPKRRAERQVYEALATTISEGFCYYEWRKGHEQMELDFATWIVGLGRFALQVKGGHYLLVDGDWRLQTRGGLKPIVSCPLDQAKIAALDLHDDIKERAQTDYNPFVIPVLVFPDMDGDPDIDRLAVRRGVYVVWGTANLSAGLEGIVAGRSVRPSLDSARIAREVRAVTDGLIRLCEAADAPAPTGNNGETVVPPVSRKASLSLKVGGVDMFKIEAGALRVRMTTPKTCRRRPRR